MRVAAALFFRRFLEQDETRFAPFSLADTAAAQAALPPPTTMTSYMELTPEIKDRRVAGTRTVG